MSKHCGFFLRRLIALDLKRGASLTYLSFYIFRSHGYSPALCLWRPLTDPSTYRLDSKVHGFYNLLLTFSCGLHGESCRIAAIPIAILWSFLSFSLYPVLSRAGSLCSLVLGIPIQEPVTHRLIHADQSHRVDNNCSSVQL